jgi:organic hydroperoxide reductase OsmC/OhrA
MSEHHATVEWRRATPDFKYATYNRAHVLRFDGGIEVAATAAPGNVPASAAPGVDPEQAFVAAISSCHMLWFLHLACTAKLTVDRYVDDAVGVLARNRDGRMAITRVTLRPAVSFGGAAPTRAQLGKLHEKAHEECFIASSVLSEIVIELQETRERE